MRRVHKNDDADADAKHCAAGAPRGEGRSATVRRGEVW
jgi:hypothetical protein